MEAPRELLDLKVLSWINIDQDITFTGKLKLFSGGQRIGKCPNLAIVQNIDTEEFLLLHCDIDWNVRGVQAWNSVHIIRPKSINDIMKLAEKYYEGASDKWQKKNA